jgi:hypothetical protein
MLPSRSAATKLLAGSTHDAMVSNRPLTDRARSIAGSASNPVLGAAAVHASARSSATSGPRWLPRISPAMGSPPRTAMSSVRGRPALAGASSR